MKKKNFLLAMILISITFFSLNKVKAAQGSWYGDYCTSCGSYGVAGECDKVKYTDVGLFRVTFYLNGEKIGSSVNISSNQTYADLARNASYSWGNGATDIVTYAKGASLNLTSGGIETIIVPGIATSNVQSKLSPKKNSATVQQILNAAGITNFSFKNGKIYYKPSNITSSDEACDYQIQMIVEAMQVINWLCTSDGNDSYRWVGTPYELNNGLRQLEPSYNSSSGGNGWYSGSVVDKYLLSALRLNEAVTVGGIEFIAVKDCLTGHITGYEADMGYGINIYDLTGEFVCEPPDDSDVCTYTPGEEFNIECCEDESYLNDYASYNSLNPDDVYGKYCSVCYFNGDCNDITTLQQCCEDTTYISKYIAACGDSKVKTYCEPDTCTPPTLTGNATCKAATCVFDADSNMENTSIFKDPVFNSENSSIKNLIDDDGKPNLNNLSGQDLKNIASDFTNDSFLAVAYQGETYRFDVLTDDGEKNEYCDLYCQEIAVVTLPDFSPAANAGRYFQWYITETDGTFIQQEVTRICAEDIKLDDFIEDYYEWMMKEQKTVDTYTNYNAKCGGATEMILSFQEAVNGKYSAVALCEHQFGCCMRNLPNCPVPQCGKDEDCTSKMESFKACIKALKEKIKACHLIRAECSKTFPQSLTDWHNSYINKQHSFETQFKKFLGCFDENLGQEIQTNLQFNFDAGDLGNYFSEGDFSPSLDSDETSIITSDQVCVDGNDCDGSYYSYKPRIEDYNTDKNDSDKMDCQANYWASTDLSSKSPVYCTTTNNPKRTENITTYKDYCYSIFDGCVSNYISKLPLCHFNSTAECDIKYQEDLAKGNRYCEGLFGATRDQFCENWSTDELPEVFYTCSSNDSKVRVNPVPNFVENENISGPNDLPMEVKDFNATGAKWTLGKTAGQILDEIGQSNLNWFTTFRLLAQSKTDSYTLNEGVNACVCSDGTVGNLISKEEGAEQGLEISGDYYCDCDPEISENEYHEETSGIGEATSIQNERWGTCKYSAYTTIREGGNYSIKYMSGSGNYPLSIYYWNIGSIDPDGDAHFNGMLDQCEHCLGGECEYSGEACKLFIGNAIMTDSWSTENTDWWDLSASYYVCKGRFCDDDRIGDDDDELDDDDDDDDTCPEGYCPNPDGLAIIYRTIDLNEPFPDRWSGDNWQGNETIIEDNRGVSGTALYSSNLEPLYTFKFTPDVIKEIRAFNSAYGRDYASSSTIAYPNDQMTKIDDDGNVVYTKGISQVLNNELIVYFANAAATNGDDLDEWFDVPLIKNCDDYTDVTGNSYCQQIDESSYVIISGDQTCWENVASVGGGK